jgi:competence protein ComEC
MPGLMIDRFAEDDAADASLGSDKFTVVFIDVGQGDATLIKAPGGEAILIDAGPWEASDAVVSTLEQEGISRLTAIVATHYHEDHIGGIPAAMEAFPTEVIYDRGNSYGEYSPAYEHYLEAAASRREAVDPCDRIHVGEVVLQTVAANGEVCGGRSVAVEGDENAASLAFVVEHGDFRMFIGGDLTGGGGNFPYNTPDVESLVADIVGDVDALKVSHHGSHTSSNQTFLDTLQPEISVISCGDDNDHGHPHSSVVDRLLQSGSAVYQTEQCWTKNNDVAIAHGNITLTVDENAVPSLSF